MSITTYRTLLRAVTKPKEQNGIVTPFDTAWETVHPPQGEQWPTVNVPREHLGELVDAELINLHPQMVWGGAMLQEELDARLAAYHEGRTNEEAAKKTVENSGLSKTFGWIPGVNGYSDATSNYVQAQSDIAQAEEQLTQFKNTVFANGTLYSVVEPDGMFAQFAMRLEAFPDYQLGIARGTFGLDPQRALDTVSLAIAKQATLSEAVQTYEAVVNALPEPFRGQEAKVNPMLLRAAFDYVENDQPFTISWHEPVSDHSIVLSEPIADAPHGGSHMDPEYTDRQIGQPLLVIKQGETLKS